MLLLYLVILHEINNCKNEITKIKILTCFPFAADHIKYL